MSASVATRLNRLESKLTESDRYQVWVRFGWSGPSRTIELMPGKGLAVINTPEPGPWKPGTHIYGLKRGVPYPEPKYCRTEEENAKRVAMGLPARRQVLSAEQAGEVIDATANALSGRAGRIVREAKVVVIICA